MRKFNLVLLMITLIAFTSSCNKKNDIINYEGKRASVNIEDNGTEVQNTESDSYLEQETTEQENNDDSKDQVDTDQVDTEQVNTDHEEILESNLNQDQISMDEADTFDIDDWGVDWESYKTFDVSKRLNVSKFTFDVITALSDNPDPVSGAYISTDSIITYAGTERHQLSIYMGNSGKSDINNNIYSGDENEIVSRYDDFVKMAMGSTMYDAQFREKGTHKMFTYKHVGDPLTKCTITGRIFLANAEDSVPIIENSSFPDRLYRVKWIEIRYTSPQIAQSAENEVTEKEIEQFDKFFDHLIDSLVIED